MAKTHKLFVRKPGNLPCICRIDQPSTYTHGWYVRVRHISSTGEWSLRKFFSDGKHGGQTEALIAAVLARDEALGWRVAA